MPTAYDLRGDEWKTHPHFAFARLYRGFLINPRMGRWDMYYLSGGRWEAFSYPKDSLAEAKAYLDTCDDAEGN